ncbi:MAG: hypothetical protein H0U95_14460 [Bacteroidetes bacterium]|nr:hypothetical protein [Bacteroidota bacterium]
MVLNFNWYQNLAKMLRVKKNGFLLIAFVLLSSFIYSQNPIAEVYSGRIQNSDKGSSFYFRILDVNQVAFDDYYNKSKGFVLFNNYKSGYSTEYKIGSLYYSSSKPFNLTDIHSLLKQLGFATVKYDDVVISVNDLPGKPIVTPERNPNNKAIRN